MDVTTVQFSNRQELANAFERWASDARVELCVADPARLVLRYALGLAPVASTSDRRSHLARSHPDGRDPARGRPRATRSQR
jgi:hypothetical protein